MKKVLFTIILAVLSLCATAQKITHNFNNVSLSDALTYFAKSTKDYRLNFIYDELEDFPVTTKVTKQRAPEAIRQVIGFYPLKMTIDGKDIFVECVQKQEHKFKGGIVDAQGQPVPFVNIALLSAKDSSFITGGVSNEAGRFVIPSEAGHVVARISCVGYQTIHRPFGKWNVGNIVLYESTAHLKNVTVKGQRIIVKAESGHLVYNMPQLLETLPADNAYEALTRIPGVMDTGNDLTFSGRSVTLIINGKTTALSDEQVKERLKQMPATMLAKAEVMASAPAKYHVRGMAINIVTKDYVGTSHLSGQLQGSLMQSRYTSGMAKGSLNVQHGKLGLDVSYSFADGKNYGQVEHEAHHPLSDKRIDYADKTKRKGYGPTHDYHLGMEYAFSKGHSLSVDYTGRWLSNHGTNTSTGTETTVQQSRLHNYLHNVDVNYSLPFGLQLGAAYTNYQAPKTQMLDGHLNNEVRQLSVDSRQRISKWLFTADQTHDLSNGWELDYGVKAQFTSNESYQTTREPKGTTLADATSHVDYDERILNGYVGFSKQFSSALSMDASVAAEQYHAPKWNEWRIYPTFNLMWNVDKNNMLNASFSSDAVYPSYWSTMSSINYTSAYSEIWGNPDLKPSASYNFNITWQHHQRYNFGIFTNLQPDYFVQLAYQPSDRMAVIMKHINFDYSNQVGAFSSARFNVGGWLNGMVNATALYRHDKSDEFFDLPFNRRHLSAILSGTVSAKLSRHQNLLLMLMPFFQSEAIQGVYDINPMSFLNAQLRWTSPKGKWSLMVAGNNIFNSHMTTHSSMGNQDYTLRIWNPYSYSSFTVIYRFGGFKEKKHKKVDTSRMGY